MGIVEGRVISHPANGFEVRISHDMDSFVTFNGGYRNIARKAFLQLLINEAPRVCGREHVFTINDCDDTVGIHTYRGERFRYAIEHALAELKSLPLETLQTLAQQYDVSEQKRRIEEHAHASHEAHTEAEAYIERTILPWVKRHNLLGGRNLKALLDDLETDLVADRLKPKPSRGFSF